MPKISNPILVAILGERVFLRIPERANCLSSIELDQIITTLHRRGREVFVLDLTQCTTMDSTFLGVLAGFVLPADSNPKSPSLEIRLRNANRRITALLESLCVDHLFTFESESESCTVVFETFSMEISEPTKAQVNEISLKAHLQLMEIDPLNIPKFKDVTQFLREDSKAPPTS